MKREVVFDHVSLWIYARAHHYPWLFLRLMRSQKGCYCWTDWGWERETTIVNLWQEFLRLGIREISVSIIVDTKDMKAFREHTTRFQWSLDAALWRGKNRENLIYNQRVGISDERMIEASKGSGESTTLSLTLPDGYDTVLDDTVTVCWTWNSSWPLLVPFSKMHHAILDEAIFSRQSWFAMDRLMEGHPLSYTASTIRNADLILVMKDSNIIEQGSHEGN